MPNDRMRRVNEAVREVLSEAITTDLKDPRVGFVTVTAVDTSPDLRHAHVFVSVLGDEKQRDDSLAGLSSSHGYLQSRVASQLRLKHTPHARIPVRPERRAGDAHQRAAARPRGRLVKADLTPTSAATSTTDREQVVDELRVRREVPADHARESRRRRARIARRDERDPASARQGQRDVPVQPRTSRSHTSTARCRSATSNTSCRPTPRSARSCSSTAGTSTGCPSASSAATARTS